MFYKRVFSKDDVFIYDAKKYGSRHWNFSLRLPGDSRSNYGVTVGYYPVCVKCDGYGNVQTNNPEYIWNETHSIWQYDWFCPCKNCNGGAANFIVPKHTFGLELFKIKRIKNKRICVKEEIKYLTSAFAYRKYNLDPMFRHIDRSTPIKFNFKNIMSDLDKRRCYEKIKQQRYFLNRLSERYFQNKLYRLS